MTLHTASEMHRWFRDAGAPLILSTAERARWTLARAMPILLWLTASILAYLLLWNQLVVYTDEATPTTLTDAADQLSDDVFLLLLLGITVLPPLFLLFLPWQVARLQRRLSLGLQTLLGLITAGVTAYALSPAFARALGAYDLADLTTVRGALITVGGVLLGVFFGVDSLLIWVLRQTRYELLTLSTMVAKVLPVLMVAVLFFFVNGDIWRVADALSFPRTLQVIAVIAALCLLVVISTVTEKTRRLLGERRGDQVESYSMEEYAQTAAEAGNPWPDMLRDVSSTRVLNPPVLGRQEWYNLVSLPMVVQAIQALFFGTVVCLFFVWFGMIAVPDATVTSWLVHEAEKVKFAGVTMPFSLVLVKVSMVLGAFAALSFVAQTASDDRYANEFLRPAIEDVRRTVMIRNIYQAMYQLTL